MDLLRRHPQTHTASGRLLKLLALIALMLATASPAQLARAQVQPSASDDAPVATLAGSLVEDPIASRPIPPAAGSPELIAQVFSPGELTRVHAEIDSIRSCSSCHAGQNKLDPQLCFSCHEEIGARVRARDGYHGSGDVRQQTCQSCHAEHKGRGAPTIEWPRGQQSLFPHDKTGWALKGAHTKQDCTDCHQTRRITDKGVLGELKAHSEKKTFLGLDSSCTACHFDEHRGQLKGDCTSCHDQQKWKPTPGFDHDKAWPLKGGHARAECAQCHDRLDDTTTAKGAFPAPVAFNFLSFEEQAHGSCTDCHQDPHRNQFGQDCQSCHNVESWKADLGNDALAFHDKTRYPLKGQHRQVTCQSCHPTVRGKKQLRPIAFETCASCHPSAHPDQAGTQGATCEDCHTVDGFAPARFTLEAHASAGFAITDAHLSVGCQECHTSALGEPWPKPAKPTKVKGKLAHQMISPWRLATDADLSSCQTCHTSPHRDQFADKACAECHTGASWKAIEGFDHTTKTGYPLEGEHKQVDCALCHPSELDDAGRFTRYAPLPSADCAACHADAHYGQFDDLSPALTCSQCHSTDGFTALRFDHNSPSFSDFPLRGRHSALDCQSCHKQIQLTEKIALTGFRPVPDACGQCHEDNHDGAYKQAATLVAARSPSAPDATPAWGLPLAWAGPHGGELTRCEACHVEEGWSALSFDHGLTRFPLRGGHVDATCEACHTGPTPERPPMDCASCHQDVHRGNLGTSCQGCHSELSFNRPEKMLARHAMTSFPLTGRHAVVPCSECHADVRDLGFADAPTECAACHMKDAPPPGSSTLDHTALSTCSSCHTPLAWADGALVDHERCFPIRPGTDHAGVSCQSCHTSQVPAVLTSCDSNTASCVACHGCEAGEHNRVAGYECEDRKCYQCHPGGS